MLIETLRSVYKENNNEEKVKKETLEYFEPKLKTAVAAGKNKLSIDLGDLPEMLKSNMPVVIKTLSAEGLSVECSLRTMHVWGWTRPEELSADRFFSDVLHDWLFATPSWFRYWNRP